MSLADTLLSTADQLAVEELPVLIKALVDLFTQKAGIGAAAVKAGEVAADVAADTVETDKFGST